MRSIDDTIARLPSPRSIELPTPPLNQFGDGPKIGLAVESMKRHMTDEGWVIFEGLEHAGYNLFGYGLLKPSTNVKEICSVWGPHTVVLQDLREWDISPTCFRDPKARFTHIEALKSSHSIFKGTVLKDSHQRPEYHRKAADDMGCHFWIVYYHPKIVKHLAPYVRVQHLIRTYHSVNVQNIPALNWNPNSRAYCLLSGAMSSVYPLRVNISRNIRAVSCPQSGQIVNYHAHPGYHRDGCATPGFIRLLANYKISLCTSSIYGYALRKIVESTACGCVVITDLPSDEVLPHIDGNLVRVDPRIEMKDLGRIIKKYADAWNPERQKAYSNLAKEWYSHIAVGKRLADDIESLRVHYND